MNISRRGVAVTMVALAVVVVYAVYFINVESQKKLGEMLSSTMKRLTLSSSSGGGASGGGASGGGAAAGGASGGGAAAGGASGGGAAAGDSLPPLSEFAKVKDNSKLAEFRQDINMPALPSNETLQTMSIRQLGRLLLRHLDNVDVLCSNNLRMGKIGDGGWEVCDDARWRPMGKCVIYSFGINNDFSFDDQAGATYQCHVYSFDPSMKAKIHDRNEWVHFYNWGIAGKDEVDKRGWELYTVETIRKKLGHSKRPIDVFKMDVEGSEWASLPNMVATGQLKDIRQMFVEFHLHGFAKPKVISMLQTLRDLEQAGFRKFHSHKNPACTRSWDQYPGTITSCYEVYFVNIRLLNAH